MVHFREGVRTSRSPIVFREFGVFAVKFAADAASYPLRYPFRSYDVRVSFGRQRTGTRVFDINRDGVAHYGLMPDLLANVERSGAGAAAMRTLFSSAAAYLRTWQRAVSAR
jgi:hypothetical protein